MGSELYLQGKEPTVNLPVPPVQNCRCFLMLETDFTFTVCLIICCGISREKYNSHLQVYQQMTL